MMIKNKIMMSEVLENYQIIFEMFENNFFEKLDTKRIDSRIDLLLQQKILIKEEKKLYINLNMTSNVFLKKFIDQVKFERIDQKLQNEILYIQALLLKENRNKIFSIFISGSVARNTYTKTSDLDVVIIHSGEKIILPKLVNRIINVQFITYPKHSFSLESLNDNELLIWALKYGLLIYDRNYIFKKIHAFSPSDYNNQIIVKKRSQIDFMCNTFEMMINDKYNIQIDMREMVYKILHLISRYIILSNGDFPLSRPELKHQVHQYNNEIINIYDFLEYENLSTNKLVDIYFNLKKIFKDFIVVK